VMFVASDAPTGCEIALDASAAFANHPLLPPVRAGVAAGEVLMRDGDYYGPTVNLAARIVKVVEAGTVAAPGDLRSALEAAGLRCEPAGAHELKGIELPLSIVSVTRR